MQGIKKFVHIEDAGRLDQDTVIAAHSHGNQLRLESPAVAVTVAAARYHFQLAVIAAQI